MFASSGFFWLCFACVDGLRDAKNFVTKSIRNSSSPITIIYFEIILVRIVSKSARSAFNILVTMGTERLNGQLKQEENAIFN